MAHEIDMTNDRANIAYTNDTPWHGLGQRVPPNAPIEVWAEMSGLTWTAERSPAFYHFRDVIRPAGDDVLYRSDNGFRLGTVSKEYKVVQPHDVLDFFRGYVDGLGAAFTMETVGSLRGGKRIWGLAKAKEGLFMLPGGDAVERYLLMATSFDKTLATVIQQTSVRVVCQNTLSAAYAGQGQDATIRVSHHASFSTQRARELISMDASWASFQEDVERYSRTHITPRDLEEYFRKVLEIESTKDTPQLLRLLDIHKRAPGQELESANGTIWGAINAVTYLVDHVMGEDRDVRMDQSWFGQRRSIKRRALQLAHTLAA